jgi:SAM-dependent methyltransferase
MTPTLLNKIKEIGRQESFQPSLLSVFINPFYFIRRGLFIHIRTQAKMLKGILLDFGCGRKPYKNLFQVEKYIGVDIEVSGHSHALSEIDVYYDGSTIPFPDGHFNSIFCSEVLEHVFEIDSTLIELNRVLKKNGKLLFTVPFVWNDHEIPYDYGRYSTYGLTYLLEKHGFKIIEINKSTNFIETLFQLGILYVHQLIKTPFKILNMVFNILLISPFTVLGIILSKVLPKKYDLYHNSIILAYKE